MRALDLAYQLVFCIGSLARRGSNPGNIVARLEESAFRPDFQHGSGAFEAKDVEAFGSEVVVVSIESAMEFCSGRNLLPGASS
jgi:hypothetical protein